MSKSVIKFTNDCNHCSVRSKLINNKIVGLEYSRCSNLKRWDHATLLSHAYEFRRKFIEDLLHELITKKSLLVEVKDVFNITEDILVYLEKEEDNEHITN